MIDIDLSTYKSLYLKTAREHLGNLRKNLELLKLDSNDKKAVFEMFRMFHSLKSQNFFMGFAKSARVCKLFEDYFREINDGKIKLNPGKLSFVSEAIEKLENSLTEIEKNNTEIDLGQDIINLGNTFSTV